MHDTNKQEIIEKIEEAEQELVKAMLHSNVEVLEKILSPNLVFTNHLGQIMTKEDDIAAHRNKVINIQEIISSDLKILLVDSIAIVTTHMFIKGVFGTVSAQNDYRFTRIWKIGKDRSLELVAGHSSVISN